MPTPTPVITAQEAQVVVQATVANYGPFVGMLWPYFLAAIIGAVTLGRVRRFGRSWRP